MLKLYTYIYACVLVHCEHQRKRPGSGEFQALMIMTIIVLFNAATVITASSAILHMHFASILGRKDLVIPICISGAVFCWFAFVRNGKGRAMADKFKEKDDDSILRCQIIAGCSLFGSIALWAGTLFILIALLPPPAAPGSGNAPRPRVLGF